MAPHQPGHDRDQLLLLLLEICADFFDRTSAPVRAELDALLREHDITGGPGWMIDMLTLTHLRLHHQHTANQA